MFFCFFCVLSFIIDSLVYPHRAIEDVFISKIDFILFYFGSFSLAFLLRQYLAWKYISNSFNRNFIMELLVCSFFIK